MKVFKKEKYQLVYLEVTAKTSGMNIHDVCGICGRILNRGFNANSPLLNPKERENIIFRIEGDIIALNRYGFNYTLDDFFV